MYIVHGDGDALCLPFHSQTVRSSVAIHARQCNSIVVNVLLCLVRQSFTSMACTNGTKTKPENINKLLRFRILRFILFHFTNNTRDRKRTFIVFSLQAHTNCSLSDAKRTCSDHYVNNDWCWFGLICVRCAYIQCSNVNSLFILFTNKLHAIHSVKCFCCAVFHFIINLLISFFVGLVRFGSVSSQ